jgi:hypothetical protein
MVRVRYSHASVDGSYIAYVYLPGRLALVDPLSLTPADYNGDGVEDLAVGDRHHHDRGAVFVYLGSAHGLPEQPSTTLLGPPAEKDAHWEFGGARADVHSLAAADVNGDGRDDLAVDQVKYVDNSGQSVPAEGGSRP